MSVAVELKFPDSHYSPEMQGFASEDPIGFLGRDANIYRYVFSNPLAYIDPFGLDTCGTGWSFNFSVFAHTFTIGRQKVLDNLGNRDTQWTLGLGAGGSTGASVSLNFDTTRTTAKTVNNLLGGGAQTGVTASVIYGRGLEAVVGEGFKGINTSASWGLGASVYVIPTWTW